MILFIGILCLIISCFICIYTYKYKSKINEINTNIQNENNCLQLQNQQLKEQKRNTEQEINIKLQELTKITESINNDFENKKLLSSKAFENYCNVLDNDYKQKEKEYTDSLALLHSSYEKQQLNLITETNNIKSNLDSIKATQTALLEARIKEQKIKEEREFYMLCPKTTDIDDIQKLEKIKVDLHNPRILSMLIWSTFFQKPMTTLCNNILGTNVITGIYKITNQNDDMCYIGQAVDVATRWKNHAKCGLGIDTPAGNKLYKAMQEEGIWNFSWELLEECPREKLNEKEKFYIDLYQSKDFGYNTTKGNL